MHPRFFLVTLLATLLAAGHAAAQHDHGSDHPDIEVELDGLDIGTHPEGVNLFASHDNYGFTKPTTTWRATFPGFEGENLGANRTFNLVALGNLFEYDDAQPDGSKFVAATDEFLRIVNTSLNQVDVTGASSGEQALPDGVGTTDGTGDLHAHPVFQLRTTSLVGDPDDGAYLLQFKITSAGLNDSDPLWVLFHKGLDDLTYDTAIHEAEDQFGLTVIPEPATFAVIGLAGAAALARRLRVA